MGAFTASGHAVPLRAIFRASLCLVVLDLLSNLFAMPLAKREGAVIAALIASLALIASSVALIVAEYRSDDAPKGRE